jgi:hypothetical protein
MLPQAPCDDTVGHLWKQSAVMVMDLETLAVDLDLDVVGALEGTDKSSSATLSWDYLRHYQQLFAPWRDQPINFMEIGVARGLSLNVWRTFFSRANIVGIDINPSCARLAGNRVIIKIGSQEDPGFMHAVCAQYPPSIVIDDGSHEAHHTVFTFEEVFPALLAGGLYVIEDTELHFEKWVGRFAGDGSVSVPDYFGAISRARMANGTEAKKLWGRQKYIAEHVDSITFIGGAIIVQKRQPRDVRSAIEYADVYLSRCPPTSARYVRLAEFILRHHGPLDRAIQAARQAVSLGDPTSAALATLMRVLERREQFDEAAEAAAKATEEWPDQPNLWRTLARIQRRRGLPGAAAEALRKVAALQPKDALVQRELSIVLEEADDLRGAHASAIKAAELAVGHPAQPELARRAEVLRSRLGEAPR